MGYPPGSDKRTASTALSSEMYAELKKEALMRRTTVCDLVRDALVATYGLGQRKRQPRTNDEGRLARIEAELAELRKQYGEIARELERRDGPG